MNRRDFLKSLSLSAAALSLPLSPALAQMRAATAGGTGKRPNVLFIPVDDLKPLLGCYGDRRIISPNIDRLAKRGMVFLNAQCQQAVCGPSRASLLTGLYPDSTGVHDLKTRMRDVHADVLALPQYFRQQGYTTAGLGKTYDPRCVDAKHDEPSWSIPYRNKAAGFRYNPEHPKPKWGYHDPAVQGKTGEVWQLREKHIAEGAPDAQRWPWPQVPGSHPATECIDLPDDAYEDGALANSAIDTLKQLHEAGEPFFLSVGFFKPHLPFIAPKKYWDLYDRSKIDIAEFQQLPADGVEIAYQSGGELRRGYSDVPEGDLPADYQKLLIHGYYACVSYIDAQIGRLLDQLDALGIADDTIVCLWGDHGWHLGDHAMWCKHSNFEQAVRSPLILAGPGISAVGRKADSVVGFVDIFPTLCELAELAVPPQLQGVSLRPILDDPAASVKRVQMSQYPRVREGSHYMGYSLRSKRYRATYWIVDRLGDADAVDAARWIELYDYQTDPQERVNLAGHPTQRERVRQFAELLRQTLALGRRRAPAS